MMRERGAMLALACAALLLPAVAVAQLPPAADLVPPGFKLNGERNLGGSAVVEATRPNDSVPKPHADLGITLEITWMNNPAVDQILELLAAQPEDPAGQSPGSATREEPCGKEDYRGRILTCRKVITPWIGAGKGPDLVMWRLAWTGKGQKGGMVGVSINNFCGSPATARAWIDAIVPKISTAR